MANSAFNNFMAIENTQYAQSMGTFNSALTRLTSQSMIHSLVASPAQTYVGAAQYAQGAQASATNLFSQASQQSMAFDTPIFSSVNNTLKNYANVVGQAQLITANNSGKVK